MNNKLIVFIICCSGKIYRSKLNMGADLPSISTLINSTELFIINPTPRRVINKYDPTFMYTET